MTRTECGVLVVDDDLDIRSVVTELLTDEGYQVKTAVNGRDAHDDPGNLAVRTSSCST